MTGPNPIRYPIVLEPDEDTLLVSCPDLPEVNSYGMTEAQALYWATDALETALAGRLADGLPIPYPSRGAHMVAIGEDWAAQVRERWAYQSAASAAAAVGSTSWAALATAAAFAALGRRVAVGRETV